MTVEQVITIIGGTAAIVTAIWHAAMYVGKLTVRMERVEGHVRAHAERLDDHDNEFRFLKGLPPSPRA